MGLSGTIIRYDGGAWSAQTSGSSQTLYGVWTPEPGKGIAASPNGMALVNSGSGWQSSATGTTENLWDVDGLGFNTAYAVGDKSTVMHWNGSQWTRKSDVPGPDSPYSDWWRAPGYTPEKESLYKVIDFGNGLMVFGPGGALTFDGSTGRMVIYTTEQFNTQFAAAFFGSMTCLSGLVPMSHTNTAEMGAFRETGSYLANFMGLGGPGGQVLFLDDRKGLPMTSGSTANLKSVWGSSASGVYAVGDDGNTLFYNGTAWSVRPRPTATHLNGVNGSGEMMAIVGNTGKLAYDFGSGWYHAATLRSENFNGVWCASPFDLFAVGDGGTIFRFYSASILVATGSASNVAGTSATLTGVLLALGDVATVDGSFDYGTSTAYGNTTASQALTAPGQFTAQVTGLTAGTTYHFRAKGDGGAAGVAYGAAATFVTGTGLVAETALAAGADSDGLAVVNVNINRVKDGGGATAVIPGGVGGYSATSSPSGGIELLGVRGVAPYDGPTFNATTGVFGVASVASPSQPSNATLARLVPRLTGDKDTTCTLNVAFQQILAASGGTNVPEDGSKSLAFRRGNVKVDSQVDVFDAMYIAQCIVGVRPWSEINVVNAASVKHDGAGGDKVDIFDAMYIAQYIVGLRNNRFEWTGGGG